MAHGRLTERQTNFLCVFANLTNVCKDGLLASLVGSPWKKTATTCSMSISKVGIVLRVAPYRLRTSVLEFIVESSVGDDEFDLQSTLIAKSVVASVHQLRRRVPDPLHSDTLIGSAASCSQQCTYLCASPRSQELDPSRCEAQ